MSDFRTTLILPDPGYTISYQDKIYSIGSCFADAMGNRLVQGKFKAMANPFGVIFNPVSVFRLLQGGEGAVANPHQYIERDGQWYNYQLHSSYNAGSQQELEKEVREVKAASDAFLKDCNLLIITLGTAFVYELAGSAETVANCHKMPAALFNKRMLSVQEIVEAADAFFETYLIAEAGRKVVLTVSPVRHIKDTLPLNSVSKATLRLAAHQLQEKWAQVQYFPSYEIMQDDLRDYRFYKKDMLHPSEVAEDYIWEKFTKTYLSAEALQLLAKWNKLSLAVQHKPFQVQSEAHQRFVKDSLVKLKELAPTMEVSKEISLLEQQLI
jgi:hypothetical protein